MTYQMCYVPRVTCHLLNLRILGSVSPLETKAQKKYFFGFLNETMLLRLDFFNINYFGRRNLNLPLVIVFFSLKLKKVARGTWHMAQIRSKNDTRS